MLLCTVRFHFHLLGYRNILKVFPQISSIQCFSIRHREWICILFQKWYPTDVDWPKLVFLLPLNNLHDEGPTVKGRRDLRQLRLGASSTDRLLTEIILIRIYYVQFIVAKYLQKHVHYLISNNTFILPSGCHRQPLVHRDPLHVVD